MYHERDLRAAGRVFTEMVVDLDDIVDVELPACRTIRGFGVGPADGGALGRGCSTEHAYTSPWRPDCPAASRCHHGGRSAAVQAFTAAGVRKCGRHGLQRRLPTANRRVTSATREQGHTVGVAAKGEVQAFVVHSLKQIPMGFFTVALPKYWPVTFTYASYL